MKTIVLVINDLKGNGAERVVITLADQFIAQGHRCHIVCFKRFRELPSSQKLKVHIFPLQYLRWIPRKWRGRLLAPLLDKFIRRQTRGTPDLVLSNLLPADRILCLSNLPNVHLIMHSTLSRQENLNDQTITERTHKLEQLSKIYTQKPVICVSQGVKTDFCRLFPEHHEVITIYNPADTEFIHNSAQNSAGAEIPNGDYLIHVGKFNRAKRHDKLLKAYAASQISSPLVLVGQGPLFEDCTTLAHKLGVDKRVIFAGFHANPYPLIANAKGMIVSSDYEGLGMVILEAITLGIPVISTDCPSGPGEILPAKNLVPVNDEQALATKIQELVEKPDHFLVPFSRDFSPETAVRQYLALIPANL
ncbi:MAG: glycosyltransferase [Thiolinea sp.]